MKQSFGALQFNMTYLKAINKYFATFLKVFLERLILWLVVSRMWKQSSVTKYKWKTLNRTNFLVRVSSQT